VNALTETGTAGFLARYEAACGSLPGDSTLRAAAADAFRTLGLPGTTRGRRAEAWKYTTLQLLGEMSFSTPVSSGAVAAIPPAATARLVFSDVASARISPPKSQASLVSPSNRISANCPGPTAIRWSH